MPGTAGVPVRGRGTACRCRGRDDRRGAWRSRDPSVVVSVCAARRGRPVPSAVRRRRPGSIGSRTVNSVWPGLLVTLTSPPCAATTAATIARPSPVLPSCRDRDESPRANRSKTCGSRSARDARARRRPRRHACGARSGGQRDGDGGARRACACGRWRAGWRAPGAAAARRPAPSTGSSGRSSCQRWSGPGGVGVADRVDDERGSGRPARAPAAGRRRGGRAAAGPRPGGHPRRPRDSTRPSACATSAATRLGSRRVSSA